MIITKNSCDLNHRGVEIESQNKSIFKHFGAPTSREVHNTLASLPSGGELSWVSVISGLDSGLEGWNWLRNIIVFCNNIHLYCVAAYTNSITVLPCIGLHLCSGLHHFQLHEDHIILQVTKSWAVALEWGYTYACILEVLRVKSHRPTFCHLQCMWSSCNWKWCRPGT